MSARILCVDDEPNILAAFQRSLRKDFQVDVASGGAEALQFMKSGEPYAVLIADMRMPGMNGVELLSLAAEQFPDTVRVMLTGNADQKTAVEAVNAGRIFRFLNKPCPPEELIEAVRSAVKQHERIRAERELLEGTLRGAINALTEVLSMVDPISFGLGQTLRDHMRGFLSFLQRPDSWECEIAALLSQIGHVAVPQAVLKRARDGHGLTESERDMLARVPQMGADLLAPIPRLEGVARAILYQRKCFDGSGRPRDELAGEDLPLAARILKILSDLHEVEGHGSIRGHGLLVLQKRTGHYDPKVFEAMARYFDTYLPPTSDQAAPEIELARVRDLQPDQILHSGVETIDGILIVPEGRRLTALLIEKIRNFAAVSGVREPIALVKPSPGTARPSPPGD